MHISFSVDTNTLTPEQQRGLAMLLAGITVPDPYQVEPTPGEPEQPTIKRSEVELKEGDVVVSALFDRPRKLTVWHGEFYPFLVDSRSFTPDGRYVIGQLNHGMDITEVNGLKIIEDTP